MEGIFKRYDGYSIVSYNLSYFEDKIYPHLKHSQKKNKAELLLFGRGSLERRFRKILELIHGGSRTPRELAKCLKRVKVYGPLRFLEKSEYIRKENYPMKIVITTKGLEQLQRGEGS